MYSRVKFNDYDCSWQSLALYCTEQTAPHRSAAHGMEPKPWTDFNLCPGSSGCLTCRSSTSSQTWMCCELSSKPKWHRR